MSNKVSLDKFSPEAVSLVSKAQAFADETKSKHFDPAHLMAVLLDVSDIANLFKELGITTIHLTSRLHKYLAQLSSGDNTCYCSKATISMLDRARSNLGSEKRPVNAFDLLYSLTQETSGIMAEVCKQVELTPNKINAYLEKGKNRDLDSSPYFTNLNRRAEEEEKRGEKNDVIIGRDNEGRRIVQILGRRSKHNPLLIGEPGVGKRTIIMSLVHRIVSKNIPKSLMDAKVLQLNTQNLLSGASGRGDVATRLKEALNGIQGYNTIIYIRTLDTLLAPELKINLNDLFGMLFDMPGVRVIAATSSDGLKKLNEKEAHFLQEFTHLHIDPCTPECAVEVLRGVASRYEKHHNIKIGETAINSAVKLAKRYVLDKYLPESAIDLLDEAASNKMMEVNGTPLKLDRARSRLASIKVQLLGLVGNKDGASSKAITALEQEMQGLNYQLNSLIENKVVEHEAILSEENLATVLAAWTGIPVNKFLEGENDRLDKMEDKLRERVVGQDEAVKAIAKSVRRSYVGLRDPKKPIGSFLFLGSSGVGKTEVAKALAEFLFDTEEAMVRVDCSEMQERHMVARLIGSPPGYQGAEEGGMLTEAIRRRPYSVVLFDEVEKAHPDVFNLLLQVLDDGRLTDGRGRLADFSNTIIIMTSNIGSKLILDTDKSVFETEEGRAKVKAMVQAEMKKFLRPEFINRIDDVAIFQALARETLSGILDIQVNNVQKMLADREISIKLSDDMKRDLIENSYNPAFGARPLKRAVAKHVLDPLTEAIVKGKCHNGSTLRFFMHDNRYLIEEITR